MAGIGVTGKTQCYNTLRTCQDTNNFARGTKNLWFRDASTRGASTEICAGLVEGEFTAVAGDTQIRPFTAFPGNSWTYFAISDLFFGEVGGHNLFDSTDYPSMRCYNPQDGGGHSFAV